MALDIPPTGAAVVLELATHRAEGIAQRDERVLVRGSTAARVANCEYLVGKADIDVEVVERPMAVVTRRGRDDDVAVRDVRIELLETRHQSSDAALERSRVVKMAEGDLQRQPTRGAGYAD
jgi:hypothetical protein